MRRITEEALDVLAAATVEGRVVRIAPRQLERKLYSQVNRVLEALGGKWSRKQQGHVFEGSPADALDQVLVDGAFHDKKRDLDQFFTPPPLARQVVEAADLFDGCEVLEPSAGRGALVLAVATVCPSAHLVAVELDPKLRPLIPTRGLSVADTYGGDFLEYAVGELGEFDRVVMNPPFSRGKDIVHVLHALSMLRAGGLLVAVMSAGVTFRRDRAATSFRATVSASGGFIERLPEGSFRESGTDVQAVLVTMRKGRA